MISKETIDRILETARIEEVVGDFVALKKRGTNLIGLCPFHNEKTPSFNVNPARNIFKCFGCGKGGNPVNFLMEHEHFTYPEALRQLARRYNIEIEETAPDPREQQLMDEREGLYVLNSFAQKTFSDQLWETEAGKSIGLSYFRERGFTDETVRKFQLGYSFDEWSHFADTALKAGYNEDYLTRTGLSYRNDRGKMIDRFRGRVMFPIHNLSGRIIGFGGRILKKDDKTAKYLNSPESDIYHKSKSLYGIFHAKKAVLQQDRCFLVEGYTDVISLHQAGIENVVASSGTSLTVEQIRLIGRFTKNITVLYDGDAAGIKAALRGIDLILEEGLNVQVVLVPDGDDPDSYVKKHGGEEAVACFEREARDFVVFKTSHLLSGAANDPVRKAGVIREVVETIARIPDPILRSTYVKQCSTMMEISEAVLITELNKIRRQQQKKDTPTGDTEELLTETAKPEQTVVRELTTEEQERNIIRLLLHYGDRNLSFHETEESAERPGETVVVERLHPVARYIVEEIAMDQIRFDHPVYERILRLFSELPEEQPFPDVNFFLHHEEASLRDAAVELISSPYELSDNWDAMHGIRVPSESDNLLRTVQHSVLHLKNKKVMMMLEENRRLIREYQENGKDVMSLLENHIRLEQIKAQISKLLGIDILR
ncbi:MAG: hypothetical protein RL213_1273 [Bacteroidota bacterium]|jgi:DNA primase